MSHFSNIQSRPRRRGQDFEAACNAIEELEATARLTLMLRGLPARMLDAAQIADLTRAHGIAWED